MRLIVDGSSKTEEANRSQDHNDNHENEAELGLIDAVIPTS